MIPNNLLGRYEYVSSKSNKYWHIIHDKNKNRFIAQWGKRNAASPQGTKAYSYSEALKKIKEKMNKGYQKVQGYIEEQGSNSVCFILED